MPGTEILKEAEELIDAADLKRESSEYSEAEILYLQALGIREYVLGSQSGLVQDVLEKLESTYEEDGRFDDAERIRSRMNVPPMAA